MINILETEGLSLNDFKKLLEKEFLLSNKITIEIPKSTKQFFSSSDDIAHEYLSLAIVGQILNDSSKEFMYEKTSPKEHINVSFDIVPKDNAQFYKAVIETSYFYTDNINNNDVDEDYFLNKQDEFNDFASKNDIACPFFYSTFLEFQNNEE